MIVENIYNTDHQESENEIIQTLFTGNNAKFERIITHGQVTPEGQWLSSEQDEWVLLLKGQAQLTFEKNDEIVQMKTGDYITIPANTSHRVIWTDPDQVVVWLTCYYSDFKK